MNGLESERRADTGDPNVATELEDFVSPSDDSERTDRAAADFARIPDPLRYVWVAIATLLLVAHAYETPGSVFPFQPATDAITLAFLIFAILGLCVNYVSEVGLPGGAKFVLRKYERVQRAVLATQESAVALKAALHEYSNQMQSWTSSILLLDEHLEKFGKTDEDLNRIVARFCVERLEEARDLIQEDGDEVRLSIWWNFPELGGLVLLFSDGINDPETIGHVFAPGQGLCGQCFIEGRMYNLDDGQDSAYYERIVPNPEYHGLLLLPLRGGTEKTRGVLSVDRVAKEEFSDDAVNASSALGDLTVYALTHPKLHGIFLDDDEA
jgi:hypothetical protein